MKETVQVTREDRDITQAFYAECDAGMTVDDQELLARYFARHRLSATSAPAGVEGWKLVPVEPTEAMIDRFVSRALCVSVHGDGGWSKYAREQWSAMIAAAPAPSGQEVAGESLAQRQAREVMNPRSSGLAVTQHGQSYNATTPPASGVTVPEGDMERLAERIRAAVTYQYMPMAVRRLLSEAASALAAKNSSQDQQVRPRPAGNSLCADKLELEPNGKSCAATHQEGSGSREIGGCDALLAGGVQRSECDVRDEDCREVVNGERGSATPAAALSTPSATPGEDRQRLALEAIKAVTATTKDAVAGLSRIMAIARSAGVDAPYSELMAKPEVALIVNEPRTNWRHLFELPAECTIPPAGWRCTRKPGHDGPCAAVATPSPGALDPATVERCAAIADVHAEPTDTPCEFTEAYELAARKIARAIRRLATDPHQPFPPADGDS